MKCYFTSAGIALMLAVIVQPDSQAAQPDAARQAALLHLLKQDCGSCHGMTLKGGLGLPLLPENLAGKPREMLVATILEGRSGTAMPPWGGQLSANDAEWLVDTLLQGVTDAN